MKLSSIIRYVILGIFNAGSIYLIPLIITFESWFLLTVLIFIAFLVNFTYLTDRYNALKWITPGVIFMFSFVVFPAGYNTYVSFTNWSTGHILTKTQALNLLEAKTYTPDDQRGIEFDIYILENEINDYYFLADLDKNNLLFGKAVKQENIETSSFATHEPSLINNSGEVIAPEGFKLLTGKEQINIANKLQELSLVVNKDTRLQLYKISVFGSSTGRLLSTSQRYFYNEDEDVLIDNSTGVICSNDGDNFICDGESVDPGWRIFVGSENYKKLFSNQRIRGPLQLVTKWTFQFATLTVLLAFVVGLLLSITLNKENLKFKRLYRSLYILPYAIPAFVSVLVWKGLLNPDYGVINNWLDPIYTFFDIEPIKWLKTKESARAAVLLVNTWLGFPYMFLITTGALQSIPKELIEAAKVDGASGIQSFWKITFPLLMVSISPLLIGSFAFNFNNFTLIFLLSGGGPPVIGSEVAVGWTDILISFSYRLAISGGRGNLFGLASSVTIIIFGIVLLISAISFRYTKRLERIYGNV